MNYINFFFSL